MTIEAATPAAQYEVRRRSVIAADLTQRFANRADPITAGQAADIDTALTALLAAITAAGFGAPVDPLVAQVANASTVPVKNSAGTVTKTGTATVAGSAVTGVALAATSAIVDNVADVTVKHFNGSVVASSGVLAEVASGGLVSVKMPTGRALITTAVKLPVGAVSGTGTFGTFTVAAGAITGIVLSAS